MVLFIGKLPNASNIYTSACSKGSLLGEIKWLAQNKLLHLQMATKQHAWIGLLSGLITLAPDGKTPLSALLRASIAHLYFETIHPFEDGNGRIGRSLAEKSLAQSLEKPAMLALSHVIYDNRKEYYAMLESSNKSNQIDNWIEYFSSTILKAKDTSTKLVEFIIKKAKFYDYFGIKINERQAKVIARILCKGIAGFTGGLSADNYINITKTSRATATRDLQNLVEIKAFTRTGTGKGTRYHLSI